MVRLYIGKLRKVNMLNDLRRVLEEGMVRDLIRFVDMIGIYLMYVIRFEV